MSDVLSNDSLDVGLPTVTISGFVPTPMGAYIGAASTIPIPSPMGSYIGGSWINFGIPLPAVPFPNSAQPSTANMSSWIMAVNPTIDDSYLKMVAFQIVLVNGSAYAYASAAGYTPSFLSNFTSASVNAAWATAISSPLSSCNNCSGYGISTLSFSNSSTELNNFIPNLTGAYLGPTTLSSQGIYSPHNNIK